MFRPLSLCTLDDDELKGQCSPSQRQRSIRSFAARAGLVHAGTIPQAKMAAMRSAPGCSTAALSCLRHKDRRFNLELVTNPLSDRALIGDFPP